MNKGRISRMCVVLAFGGLLVSLTGRALAVYDPGFVWNRYTDYTAGTDGSSGGNPDTDSLGNATYAYESLAMTGGLGSANPWWDNTRDARMGYYNSSYFGGTFWSYRRNVGPLIDRAEIEWSSNGTSSPYLGAPAVTWINPTGGSRTVDIRGALTLHYYNYTGNTDLVVAKRSAGSGVWTLLGSATLGADNAVWNVNIRNVQVNAGDYVRWTLMPQNSAYYNQPLAASFVWATDELSVYVSLPDQAFYAWQISPYVNILKQEFPAPIPVTRLDVSMAQNEYRDTVFMVVGDRSADQQITVSLETTDPVLQSTTLVQEALYINNAAGQVVGGAHYQLGGPLTVPVGQSRQIRLRFNAKAGGLGSGQHTFNLRLTDSQNSFQQLIPGTVTVWNFALPDPATVMMNNAYAQMGQSSLADMQDFMVKDMKAYGLNVFFVHPWDMSIVSADNTTVTFEFYLMENYVHRVMSNWGSGPHPKFIFSLGFMIQGLQSSGTLGPWFSQFRTILEGQGLTDADWYICFGDEDTADGLVQFELPFGEWVKSADPRVLISTNTSSMITDPALLDRYFATVDRWEPQQAVIDYTPGLLDYLRTNGKPIALYQASGDYNLRGANMYNYYRVYAWKAVQEGCVGLGEWTYCVDWNMNPWTGTANQYVMVFRHPTKLDLVHSRRYEVYREGIDDFRYVWTLRNVASTASLQTQADAEQLIQQAIADITANVTDTTRCETWRKTIAQRIQDLSGTTVMLQGKVVLGDYSGDYRDVVVKIERRQSGAVICDDRLFLNSDGTFHIDGVYPGSYDLAIKAGCCLQKVLTNVTVAPNPTDLGTIRLINGDCDGDNHVTAADLSLVLSGMGK